jgi:hypothetical protein
MSYLFSSYRKLDLLTLIAFLVATIQMFICCFWHQRHLCWNILFCDQSFLALLTHLCCILIPLQSNEQQDTASVYINKTNRTHYRHARIHMYPTLVNGRSSTWGTTTAAHDWKYVKETKWLNSTHDVHSKITTTMSILLQQTEICCY